jgi:tRNA threonylcarbamoyladenosine biosynthesis protein TsaE
MSLKKSKIFEIQIDHEKQLEQVVLEVKKQVKKNSVLLLSGDLAAGKTTFTRYFCESYGLHFIQSSTYAIHQTYQNSEITVDHFDLYRLQNEDEVESSGFWDLIQNQQNFLIVEWAEKLNHFEWLNQREAYSLQISIENMTRKFSFFRIAAG